MRILRGNPRSHLEMKRALTTTHPFLPTEKMGRWCRGADRFLLIEDVEEAHLSAIRAWWCVFTLYLFFSWETEHLPRNDKRQYWQWKNWFKKVEYEESLGQNKTKLMGLNTPWLMYCIGSINHTKGGCLQGDESVKHSTKTLKPALVLDSISHKHHQRDCISISLLLDMKSVI